MKLSLTILMVLFTGLIMVSDLSAHGQKKEASHLDEEGFEVLNTGPSAELLQEINQNYLNHIKPIFRQKCFDCHTNQTRFPWYYVIPGAKQLIDRDIREARKHLDISNDFPFEGHHGTAHDNLEALKRVIHEDRMPLWRYRILHWDAWLSKKEKESILKWIEESKIRIKKEK